MVGGMVQLVSGQIPGGAFGPEGFTGAVGIAAISSEAAQSGLLDWLMLVALLSVALGFFNLLPVPVLDGGRIMVVLLEKVRGRPFDREREMAVQRYTLAALLTLVVVISYFDVQRIVTHQFPALH
jgi:regulator of sigma E protease